MTPTVTSAIKKQKPLPKKRRVALLFFGPTVSPKRKLTCQMVQTTTMNEDRFPIEHGEKISILVILVNSGGVLPKNPRPKMLPLANYKHDNVGRP